MIIQNDLGEKFCSEGSRQGIEFQSVLFFYLISYIIFDIEMSGEADVVIQEMQRVKCFQK